MFEMTFSNKSLAKRAEHELGTIIWSAARSFAKPCESPLEALMVEAICAFTFLQDRDFPQFSHRAAQSPGGCGWRITLQAPIEKYRVDFLIEVPEEAIRIVVECDGHDFHERTKDQARRDRARDREIQALGYFVLRFTGSEIWADPWKCVEEIQNVIWHGRSGRE